MQLVVSHFTRSESSCSCTPLGLTIKYCSLLTQFIRLFRIFVTVNRDFAPLQHSPTELLIEAHFVHCDVRIQSLCMQWKLSLALEGFNSDHTTRNCLIICHIRFNVKCFNDLQPQIGFGGLEVACWPLIPKFSGSNPAEAVRFFRAKKSSARLASEGK